MKKFLLVFFITIILIIFLIFSCNAIENEPTFLELESNINILLDRQEYAHQMADAARLLGYPEEHFVIQFAKEEWSKAEQEIIKNKTKLTKLQEKEQKRWDSKRKKYPEATEIWLYLQELNYNEYICAGILGNIMAEVGGQTLNINSNLGGQGYYGICQWAEVYKKDNRIKGTLEQQLEYLKDDIKYEFDNFGFLYKPNFKYEDFLMLEDEQEAAYAFAIVYERCDPRYRNVRKTNASKALLYFNT